MSKSAGSTLFVSLILLVLATGPSVFADDVDTTLTGIYQRSHQAGLRLGVWSNQGETPPPLVEDEENFIYYRTDFSEASFYLEAYFSLRWHKLIQTEVSFGVVSRGDVTYVDELLDEARHGTLVIYPILGKLKLYSPVPLFGSFHPYVMAGGGFFYGRHDVQIVSTSTYLYSVFDDDSESGFSWVAGGGFDWPLADVIGLDCTFQYMPIDFSSDLIGIHDYSAFTISVGVKYLWQSKK